MCSNSTACSQCFPDFYLRADRICYSTCLPRTFPNKGTLTCEGCPYDCLTCDAANNCLTCDASTDHRGLNSSSGRCVPLDGYFESYVAISAQCPSSCFSCSSLSKCLHCNIHFYMRGDSLCYSTCQDRQFKDDLTLTCQPCASSAFDCLTCDLHGACLTCSSSLDFRQLNASTSRCDPLPGYF